MYTRKREAVFQVQFRNIVHQPIGGGVAAGAVSACRLLVHILVAGNTIGIGLGKNEGGVASPAIYLGVAAFELEPRFPMVKPQGVPAQVHARHAGNIGFLRVKTLPVSSRNLPARRGVAGSAAHLHGRAMRVLRIQVHG